MDSNISGQCFAELEKQMDVALSHQGFSRSSATIPSSESEFEWRRWIRETAWRRDIIELAFPLKHMVEIVGFAEVHLRGDLRYPDDDEGLFDGTTVSGLIGTASGHYQLPSSFTLFRSRAMAKYRNKILRDVVKSLEWFNCHETPAKSLERLQSGETSVGPIKNTGAAKQAFEFLSSAIVKKM